MYHCSINRCGGLHIFPNEFHDVRDPRFMPAVAFDCPLTKECKKWECLLDQKV